MLLRRKSLFFITYTIFPCLALSTLQIFSHMLPFTESERINFATTTLIAFSVFHVSIVEQMPQSSHAIPLLAIYIDALMCLIGLSLLECFLMMNWLSKVGCSVPSPRMWYYIVDKWGDYMMLGSSGRYWRQNYLRILEEVHSREAVDLKRKVYERRRWSTASRRHQVNYIKKWSNFGAQNSHRQGDINALIHLMNRWGYSFGGRGRRKYSKYPVEQAPVDRSGSKGRRCQSLKHVDDIDYDSVAMDIHPTHTCTSTVFFNENNASDDGGGSSDAAAEKVRQAISTKQQQQLQTNEIEGLPLLEMTAATPLNEVKIFDMNSPKTSPETGEDSHEVLEQRLFKSEYSLLKPRSQQQQQQGSQQQQMSGFNEEGMSTDPLPSRGAHRRCSKQTVVSYTADTKLAETSFATPGSGREGRKRSNTVSSSSRPRQNWQQQGNTTAAHDQTQQIINHQQQQQIQLNALDDIRHLIDDVNSSLLSHTLRRECIGVWTTFITVIDRVNQIF